MKLSLSEGSLLKKSHALVSVVVRQGDVVVDATMGNGYDTLFLAQCVGSSGKVIGFDVQEKALVATGRRLLAAGVLASSFNLHRVSHAKLSEYVPSGVAAVLFNLGYLPGADKSLITQVETSLDALAQSLACLRSGGLLSVMCYPGHAGGDKEAEAVKRWMEEIDGVDADVQMVQSTRALEKSPFLLVAVKR